MAILPRSFSIGLVSVALAALVASSCSGGEGFGGKSGSKGKVEQKKQKTTSQTNGDGDDDETDLASPPVDVSGAFLKCEITTAEADVRAAGGAAEQDVMGCTAADVSESVAVKRVDVVYADGTRASFTASVLAPGGSQWTTLHAVPRRAGTAISKVLVIFDRGGIDGAAPVDLKKLRPAVPDCNMPQTAYDPSVQDCVPTVELWEFKKEGLEYFYPTPPEFENAAIDQYTPVGRIGHVLPSHGCSVTSPILDGACAMKDGATTQHLDGTVPIFRWRAPAINAHGYRDFQKHLEWLATQLTAGIVVPEGNHFRLYGDNPPRGAVELYLIDTGPSTQRMQTRTPRDPSGQKWPDDKFIKPLGYVIP